MPLFTMKNCDFDQSKFFNEFYFLVFAINQKMSSTDQILCNEKSKFKHILQIAKFNCCLEMEILVICLLFGKFVLLSLQPIRLKV
jgi:hypothetical protein